MEKCKGNSSLYHPGNFKKARIFQITKSIGKYDLKIKVNKINY